MGTATPVFAIQTQSLISGWSLFESYTTTTKPNFAGKAVVLN